MPRYQPPTKKHFALNKTTGMYNQLLFGKRQQDIGIDISRHFQKIPRGSINAGKFHLSGAGINIDGIFFIDFSEKGKKNGR